MWQVLLPHCSPPSCRPFHGRLRTKSLQQGHILVRRCRRARAGQGRHALPPLIKAANPSIQTLCALLGDDLTTLKVQTDSDYSILLMEQAQFINENMSRMGAVQQREQKLKLFQIEEDGQKADASLSATKEAVSKLAETHHRLATGGTK
jgi:hypothetical protein